MEELKRRSPAVVLSPLPTSEADFEVRYFWDFSGRGGGCSWGRCVVRVVCVGVCRLGWKWHPAYQGQGPTSSPYPTHPPPKETPTFPLNHQPNETTQNQHQALLRFSRFRLRSLQNDLELYVAVLDWQPHQRLQEAIYLRGPVSKGACVVCLG